jgi:lambda family phage portal protein
MGMISRYLEKEGFVSKREAEAMAKRSYGMGLASAQQNRFTVSWKTSPMTMDQIVKQGLKVSRQRAREVALNNDYGKRFVAMMKTNIVGPSGFSFQSRIKDPNGNIDKTANNLIESAWRDWGSDKSASASKRYNWVQMCMLYIISLSVDGEAIFRHVTGADNRFGYALQPIDAALLDESLNLDGRNGHEIRMGIEFDQWDRPVNYYLKRRRWDSYDTYYTNDYEVVPASEIIHSFIPEAISQSRGFPPMNSAIMKMHNISAYEEAEIYASRENACKMGFFIPPGDDDFYDYLKKDVQGNLIEEAEPATFEVLPPDFDFKSYDPNHPNQNFSEFVKSSVRSMANGLNLSYHTFGNDLEGVNYSSARIGSLDERDGYKIVQQHMIDDFCVLVSSRFLEQALLRKAIDLPLAKYEKFNKPFFLGRRWEWTDPEKEQNSNVIGLKAKTNTWSEVLASKGKDFIDTMDQLQWEAEEMKKRGLSVDLDKVVEDIKNNGKKTGNSDNGQA